MIGVKVFLISYSKVKTLPETDMHLYCLCKGLSLTCPGCTVQQHLCWHSMLNSFHLMSNSIPLSKESIGFYCLDNILVLDITSPLLITPVYLPDSVVSVHV